MKLLKLLLAAGLLGLLSVQTVIVHANPPVILVYGDSLSAEYGIVRGAGWVALLSERLRKEGFPHRVINTSISGETTAGGLHRLASTLKKHRPQIVLLALGANDGLRGLPIGQTRRNLETMLTMAQQANAQAVVIGIRMPPNYGPEYTRAFERLFTDIGRERSLPVVPFLLEGIADNPRFFQADTIHPNEQAQPKILSNVWPILAPLLSASSGATTTVDPAGPDAGRTAVPRPQP